MARGSAKHGPRLDEEIAHDVDALLHGAPDESRTEARRQEAPGDDEPDLAADRDDAPGAPADAELDRRARLAASLPPSIFPARPAELAAAAREAHAGPEVVAALERLPDRLYDAFGEVWDEIGPELD